MVAVLTLIQGIIFDECVRPLIKACLDGYNATVFAYGQTGTGKTYTMGCSASDDDEHRGIVPRAIHDIFDQLQPVCYHRRCEVRCERMTILAGDQQS